MMGWLGKLLHDVEGARPKQLTYIPNIPAGASSVPGNGDLFVAGDCYVELYLESLRLSEARRFATKFSGVVYSFVTLSRQGDMNAKLAAVSKPQRLAELSADAIDNTITVSKQLMAPTPYSGGAISLEIGLFSVQSGNVVSPILEYVSKVSAVAGISYVGAVAPFLPLLTEGMNLIAGQREDTVLEVGLDTDLLPQATKLFAIINCSQGMVDQADLTVGVDHRLLHHGADIVYGYALFSLRATKTKSDFGEIPELRARYADLRAALRPSNKSAARDALAAFRLAAIASPDLILADAQRLAGLVQQMFDAAFPPNDGASIVVPGVVDAITKSLAEIGLYDR